MKNESELIKSSSRNGEKMMDVRHVYRIELTEIIDHGVESDAINGIKEGRLRIGFGGTYRMGYGGEMFRCNQKMWIWYSREKQRLEICTWELSA